MEMTQARVSSGYRVENAGDNAAYWSIATTMRSDNKAMSTVKDALGLGAAKVDIAYTAMNSSIDVISEIKAKLVAAREPGVDKTKIDKELTELKNQLVSIPNPLRSRVRTGSTMHRTAAAGNKGRWRFQPRRQRVGFHHHPRMNQPHHPDWRRPMKPSAS
jgi:flagellin